MEDGTLRRKLSEVDGLHPFSRLELVGVSYGLSVEFDDHITALQASRVRRTTWSDAISFLLPLDPCRLAIPETLSVAALCLGIEGLPQSAVLERVKWHCPGIW
jgi:hypothetical protein